MVTQQDYKDFLQRAIVEFDSLPCDGLFLIKLVPLTDESIAVALGACNVSMLDHARVVEALVGQMAMSSKENTIATLQQLILLHQDAVGGKN